MSSGGQHWLRVDEDVKLLRELGVNAYRFSIEWSKVQPGPGDQWNQSAIAHYSDEIDQLLANHITPMITLQHFTIPTWCVLKPAVASLAPPCFCSTESQSPAHG